MSVDNNQRLPSRVANNQASATQAVPHPGAIYPEELLTPPSGLDLKEVVSYCNNTTDIVSSPACYADDQASVPCQLYDSD